MAEMKKENRGGARKGAGRPKGRKNTHQRGLLTRVMLRINPADHAAMIAAAKKINISTAAAYRRAVKEFLKAQT